MDTTLPPETRPKPDGANGPGSWIHDGPPALLRRPAQKPGRGPGRALSGTVRFVLIEDPDR